MVVAMIIAALMFWLIPFTTREQDMAFMENPANPSIFFRVIVIPVAIVMLFFVLGGLHIPLEMLKAFDMFLYENWDAYRAVY